MKFLKSQKGAALVLLLAVAFGLIFGTYRSTMAEQKKVVAVFQDGLEERFLRQADAGYNLCSVANRYLENKTLINNIRNLCDLMYDPDMDTMLQRIENYFYAEQVLRKNGQELIGQLQSAGLSDQDAQHVRGLEQELTNGSFVISHYGEYYAAVAHFNGKVLNGLGRLLGIEPVAGVRAEFGA
jgi:hypothetical protein